MRPLRIVRPPGRGVRGVLAPALQIWKISLFIFAEYTNMTQHTDTVQQHRPLFAKHRSAKITQWSVACNNQLFHYFCTLELSSCLIDIIHFVAGWYTRRQNPMQGYFSSVRFSCLGLLSCVTCHPR